MISQFLKDRDFYIKIFSAGISFVPFYIASYHYFISISEKILSENDKLNFWNITIYFIFGLIFWASIFTSGFFISRMTYRIVLKHFEPKSR